MKESIGGTQIFIIVIMMVILFSGIMAFTINRSNAFAVKDQLVSIIERAGTFDMNSQIVGGDSTGSPALEEIVDALAHNSYRQTGTCPSESTGKKVTAYQRNGAQTLGNNDAAFCIVKIDGNSPDGSPPISYYQIIVFYKLDLPVINELFVFKAIGQTKALYS
ncbi:MAG: hypothetical protein E7164_04055 [Firmicutes bacterium]|nr:hypothetical protein [Bacillota bacterium]